jgi:hypothetical protein
MTIIDVLVGFISNVFAEFTGESFEKHLKKRLKRIGVRFAVFGFRASGKTTLIRRMIGEPIYSRYSPTIGQDPKAPFTYISLGPRISVDRLQDISGDPSQWSLWDKVFTKDKPMGIIFMIDHEHPHYHKRAFNYMLDFIGKDDRRWLFFKGRHVLAREQLKIIMFLINKQDKWGQNRSVSYFLDEFSEEFRRVDALGIPFVHHECSALTNWNVDYALFDFFRRMLGDYL